MVTLLIVVLCLPSLLAAGFAFHARRWPKTPVVPADAFQHQVRHLGQLLDVSAREFQYAQAAMDGLAQAPIKLAVDLELGEYSRKPQNRSSQDWG